MKIGYQTSLDEYVIRSTKIRCLTFKEATEHWELWDKKEECLKKIAEVEKEKRIKLEH